MQTKEEEERKGNADPVFTNGRASNIDLFLMTLLQSPLLHSLSQGWEKNRSDKQHCLASEAPIGRP